MTVGDGFAQTSVEILLYFRLSNNNILYNKAILSSYVNTIYLPAPLYIFEAYRRPNSPKAEMINYRAIYSYTGYTAGELLLLNELFV
jgi:hypothetical protein